jgi:hypothetical protein
VTFDAPPITKFKYEKQNIEYVSKDAYYKIEDLPIFGKEKGLPCM